MKEKEVKFCSHCGEKRLPDARFCFACGDAFAVASIFRDRFLLVGLLVAVLVTVVVGKFVVLPIMQKEPATPPSQPALNPRLPKEPKALNELRAKAASGAPAALMNLAEHLILLAEEDRDYLFQAAQTLETLLNSFPDHAYSLRLLGNLYYNLEVPEKAIPPYTRYLDLHPEDANVHVDLGTQYLARDLTRKAIAQYEEAIGLFPNFYNAHFNLYLAYQHLGDEATAQTYRAKAEEIGHDFGQQLAPSPELSRLPTASAGVSGTAATTTGGASAANTIGKNGYESLESFFRQHEIVGPKMTGFQVDSGIAVLLVRDFPMESMPPFARKAFDTKVRQRLAEIGAGAALEIRDADSRQTMASYPSP